MQVPSHEDALRVLLLQAADEGRDATLFGKSTDRAAREAGPFMIGEDFPDLYLECPLLGDPFLDITTLYSRLEPGTYVDHPAAAGTQGMLDWFAEACSDLHGVCCGFELDTKEPELPPVAVHFQPRMRTELVRPFCESIGEPERADLYLSQRERMPEEWPLSFFGLFRGRPGSPLRICGYLNEEERAACADDAQLLARAFDEAGFSAYDNAMLEDVSALVAAAPGTVDFQFDIFPDGTLSDTFAIDVQFGIEQPKAVRENFQEGAASRIMHLLEERGAADDRWKLIAEAAFARSVPITQDNGELTRFAFSLMPQWAKARWTNGALQPAKMYFIGGATFL